MNNTLTALNNYLFEELERLNDDSLSPEQLKQENPMEWTGRMNNQKHSIEETIYQTLIIS